jgi:hypothetical protein
MCIDPAAAGLEQDAFGRWRFSFSAAVVRGAVRAFQELVEMGVLP